MARSFSVLTATVLDCLTGPQMMRASFVTALFFVLSILGDPSYAEEMRPGIRYKVIGSVYLNGVYLNLNNRKLVKQLAIGTFTTIQFTGPELAFRCILPVGTIITVIGSAPKSFPLPFFAKQYFVRLDPDLSRGLDVVIELNRGIEGSLDGLNPDFFTRP